VYQIYGVTSPLGVTSRISNIKHMSSDATAIVLLKDVIRDTLVFTGANVGINKRAHLLPIFRSLLQSPPDSFPYHIKARPNKTLPPPGQKNPYFASFRDEWLPQALREVLAEAKGVSVDEIPDTQFNMKQNQTLSSGDTCVRAIVGWEAMNKNNAHLAFSHPLPIFYDKMWASECFHETPLPPYEYEEDDDPILEILPDAESPNETLPDAVCRIA
jgi:hypothetical protein